MMRMRVQQKQKPLTKGEIAAVAVCVAIVVIVIIVTPIAIEMQKSKARPTASSASALAHASVPTPTSKRHNKAMELAALAASVNAGINPDHLALVHRARDMVLHHNPKMNQSPRNFPIDALYTWVKGSDPAWWQSKAQAFVKHYGAPFKENPRDPLRSQEDKDELYYSVRLAAKFCPWLRRIWILTAPGQRPAWMPATGDMLLGTGTVVTVVHHDRVFDPACVQHPAVFNSNIIEAQIPHIARLAEHFIMFNDDFFVGRPLPRSAFFTDTGVPAVHLRDVSNSLRTMTTMWGQHLRNMRSEVQALGGGTGLVPDHVAAPVRKSVMKAVIRALKPKVCVLKPFRTPTDFPTWYVALNLAPSVPRPSNVLSKYFGAGPDFVKYMNSNKQKGKYIGPSLFCINQEFTPDTATILQKLLDDS